MSRVRITSQVVSVGPNMSVEIEISGGEPGELWFQTVERLNQGSVEVLTVEPLEEEESSGGV